MYICLEEGIKYLKKPNNEHLYMEQNVVLTKHINHKNAYISK